MAGNVAVELSRLSRADIRVVRFSFLDRGHEVVHALTVGSNELFIFFPHYRFILLYNYNFLIKTTLIKEHSQFPGVLHHSGEVLIAVNGRTHAREVVAEFFEGDNAVLVLGVPLGHEHLENLIGSAFA